MDRELEIYSIIPGNLTPGMLTYYADHASTLQYYEIKAGWFSVIVSVSMRRFF